MKWTQEHSQNAVAAKARRRLAVPDIKVERGGKVFKPRVRAKWRVQIRDLERGDSLTLRLYRLPWPARYVGCDGRDYSAAAVGKAVAVILREAA